MAIIDYSALSLDTQKRLKDYAQNTSEEFNKIAQNLKQIYPDSKDVELFAKQITDQANWNLKAISASGLRLDSANIGIKNTANPKQLGESAIDAILINLTSAIKYCENCRKEATGEEIGQWENRIKTLEENRASIYLIKLGAQFFLAETLFEDAINVFDRQFKEKCKGLEGDTIYKDIENGIAELKNTVVLDKPNITFTSDDALAARKKIQELHTKIKTNISTLVKSTDDELLQALDKVNGFAKAKNDLDYQNPRKVNALTAARHKITSTLERTSLLLSIIAIGASALAIATPFAMPVVGLTILLSAAIGTITGLSAAIIKLSNAAVNYVKYDTLPTKGEVATAAIGSASVLVAGVNQLGTVATNMLSSGSKLAKTGLSTTSQIKQVKQDDIKKQVQAIRENCKEAQQNTKEEDIGTTLKN